MLRMAYRFVNAVPQFLTVDGRVLAGGNLYFSDSGTSNPRPTYADPALSAENTNPVILDASGRANADLWMDGSYRVVLKDATGAVVWTRDNVEGPADLPGMAGNEGWFLGTDGAGLIWRPVLQVPAVDGQSGKVLTNDGVTPFWQNPAGNGIPALVAGKFLTNDGTGMSWADVGGSSSTSSSFTVGGILVQFGSATAPIPSPGGHVTSLPIVFTTAYGSAPRVWLQTNTGSICAGGASGTSAVQGLSTTGFNARFDTNVSAGGSTWNINTTIPFSWLAVGPQA